MEREKSEVEVEVPPIDPTMEKVGQEMM